MAEVWVHSGIGYRVNHANVDLQTVHAKCNSLLYCDYL